MAVEGGYRRWVLPRTVCRVGVDVGGDKGRKKGPRQERRRRKSKAESAAGFNSDSGAKLLLDNGSFAEPTCRLHCLQLS